jgi:hypothetical protein
VVVHVLSAWMMRCASARGPGPVEQAAPLAERWPVADSTALARPGEMPAAGERDGADPASGQIRGCGAWRTELQITQRAGIKGGSPSADLSRNWTFSF